MHVDRLGRLARRKRRAAGSPAVPDVLAVPTVPPEPDAPPAPAAAAEPVLRLVAVRAPDGGVVVRCYRDDNLVLEVPLTPRQALVAGLDMLNLSCEGTLRLEPVTPVLYGETRWGKGVKLA
jgi:hypothetical protein